MKTKQLFLSIVCVSLLSGCGIARNLTASFPLAPSIAFRSVSPTKTQEAYIPQDLLQTSVFKTQAEADTFFSNLRNQVGQPIGASLPSIDFSREQGVLVLFGSVGSGGYKGEISAIEEKADKFVIHPRLWEPAPGMAVTTAIAYPYHYVAMPRSAERRASPAASWASSTFLSSKASNQRPPQPCVQASTTIDPA